MSAETHGLASASYRGQTFTPDEEHGGNVDWHSVAQYHTEKAVSGPPEDAAHHARLAGEASRNHRRMSDAHREYAAGDKTAYVAHRLGDTFGL